MMLGLTVKIPAPAEALGLVWSLGCWDSLSAAMTFYPRSEEVWARRGSRPTSWKAERAGSGSEVLSASLPHLWPVRHGHPREPSEMQKLQPIAVSASR